MVCIEKDLMTWLDNWRKKKNNNKEYGLKFISVHFSKINIGINNIKT